MTHYIPPSIKQIGLKKYLNSPNQKVKHDGYGYDTFLREYEKGQNPMALARMFKVSRNTVLKWLVILKTELTAKK